MKKALIITAAALFGASLYSYSGSTSSVSLSEEMIFARNSGFYPGVVRYADELLKNDADSVFTGKALVYKGESLFKMGRIKDSLKTLEDADNIINNDSQLEALRLYWMARGLFSLDKTDESLKLFYRAAELSKNSSSISSDDNVYISSIYYSGKALRKSGDFAGAADCFESVLQNGQFFNQIEYEDAAIKLVECLLLCRKLDKAEMYASSLSEKDFNSQFLLKIGLLKGSVLEAKGSYKEAYDNYCKIITEGSADFAAEAMRKAYAVSSEHQGQIKEEPGAILGKAKNLIDERPELVSEFWTRLAIDSFNNNNFSKALEYFANGEKGASKVQKQLSLIYKAEIMFKSSKLSQKEAAVKALDLMKNNWKECGFEPGEDYFFAAQAEWGRFAGFAEKWDECIEYSLPQLKLNGTPPEKKTSAYWAALSYYNKDDCESALKILDEAEWEDTEFLLLKARSLAKSGKNQQAENLFKELSQKGVLDNEGRLDYIKTLLNAGHLNGALEQSEFAQGSEASYLKGLVLFNKKQWQEAEVSFEKAVAQKNLAEKYSDFAMFYLGYCQYQNGKFDKAYGSMKKFSSSSKVSTLRWDAYVTGARAAVQDGKYAEAGEMAQKAMQTSMNERQKQESVILAANIYSDSGKYSDAVEVLRPYTVYKDSFGWRCSFLTAQILVQKKDFDGAYEVYDRISREKSAQSLCEEASFRRGELKYSAEKYDEAIQLFEEYASKYYGGKFYDGALYFGAEALVKSGREDRAILYFQQVVELPQTSTYRYGAEKQLVELYKKRGDYGTALSMAKKIIDEYGDTISGDNLNQVVKELKALNAGADSKLLKKETEFEKNGGIKTAAGRKTGTELVELYRQADSTGKAEKLALELLEIQKNNESEAQYGALNALLIAGARRSRNENADAAAMYLKAAELSRKAGKNDDAARALYGAAEAFDGAGLTGDAVSTVESLKQLYPSSSYAKDAEKLIK